jgi:hypothetical protein
MFARTTIFIAIVTGTVVALALLAQATRFSRETLWLALLLISVDLFIGVSTFVRSVEINFEDAYWLTGMGLLRSAYLKIVPEVEPFFVTAHRVDAELRALSHGSHQYLGNLRKSLTTTSSTVATLDSVLAGVLASDISALLGGSIDSSVLIGAAVSIVSGASHIRYAARYRRRHDPADGQ